MRYLSLSLLLAILCVVGLTTPLSAQYAVGGMPRSFLGLKSERRAARSLSISDTLYITPPSLSHLKAKLQEETKGGLRPYRFAEIVPLQASPATYGRWQEDREGGRIWRLNIRSQGALSLGLHFSKYEMPRSASLFVYGANGIVRGAFTHHNNLPSGGLTLAPLRGDWLTIELNLPAGVSSDEVRLEIGELSYGYRDVYQQDGNGLRAWTPQHGEPFYDFKGYGLTDLRCAPNAVAHPEYTRETRATVLIMVEGNTISTGTLINNARRDGTAYVLTAAHNINRIYSPEITSPTRNDPETIKKVRKLCATIVFFFGFESPSRDQDIRGSEEKTLSGAELVAYNEEADMALLRITGLPTDAHGSKYIPPSYNAYFAGWNRAYNPPPPYHGVHHALASTKRVCVARDEALTIADYYAQGQYWTMKHWFVNRWALGTTGTGSSGSGLFDGKGHIIGALTGGGSSCASPEDDAYYAISETWEESTPMTSLKPWLDPMNEGLVELEGFDPNDLLPLSRISSLYGGATKGTVGQYTTKERVSGLGTIITIGATTEPLGVFIQLGEHALLTTESPSYEVELYAMNGGEVAPNPSWSTKISNYNFLRYKSSGEAIPSSAVFQRARRTIGLDAIELFVPDITDEEEQLAPGKYLLSIRTSSDQLLDYPVLTDPFRTTSPKRRPMAYTKSVGGTWLPASNTYQNLWIDLLVRGGSHKQDESREGSDEVYTSYAHGRFIYAYVPRGEAIVRVYDLTGRLYLEAPITQGETKLSVRDLLPNEVYIVQIKGELGEIVYKFIPY